MRHPDDAEWHSPKASQSSPIPARRFSTLPRKRIGLLAGTIIVSAVYTDVAIVSNDHRTSDVVWIINGVLLSLVAVCLAYLLAIRSRRWAIVLAIVGVGYLAAMTYFFIVISHSSKG